MAHITLPEGLPGITGLLAFRPETAAPMRTLSEFLLRGPNSLTSAEREIIATYTSSQNDCYFCQMGHGAAAAHHLGGNLELIDQVKRDFRTAPISDKLKVPCSNQEDRRLCFAAPAIADFAGKSIRYRPALAPVGSRIPV